MAERKSAKSVLFGDTSGAEITHFTFNIQLWNGLEVLHKSASTTYVKLNSFWSSWRMGDKKLLPRNSSIMPFWDMTVRLEYRSESLSSPAKRQQNLPLYP